MSIRKEDRTFMACPIWWEGGLLGTAPDSRHAASAIDAILLIPSFIRALYQFRCCTMANLGHFVRWMRLMAACCCCIGAQQAVLAK